MPGAPPFAVFEGWEEPATYIYTRFDTTYQVIFGSQLTMLQELNAVGTSPRGDVKTYYDVAVIVSPDFYANYSFDQWLHFMVSQALVRADGDAISITVAGREFLKFLIQEGRTFSKSG